MRNVWATDSCLHNHEKCMSYRLMLTQSWEMYELQTRIYTIMSTLWVTDSCLHNHEKCMSYRLMFNNAIWKTIINVQVRLNPPFPGKNEHNCDGPDLNNIWYS